MTTAPFGPDDVTAAAVPTGTTSSWAPVDLAALVAGIRAGTVVGPIPTLLQRDDGVALIYPGEVHSIAGEPESGKGWIMLAESARLIAAGQRVLYLDFEDAPASIVARLIALGAPDAAIIDGFVYVKPEDALAPDGMARLLARGPFALAVIDGVSEAYDLLGLDSHHDAPTFLRRLARPIAKTGAAVVQIDHVVKDKTNRGRYDIGGQGKLAGIATHYGVEVITAPSRHAEGKVKVHVHKDRHGHVRGHAEGKTIALATITPHDDGERVTVRLDPPDAATTTDDGRFRHTIYMERVSRHIEGNPGLATRRIRDDVDGGNDYIDKALRALHDEEFVHVETTGQARRFYSLRPYRQADDPQLHPTVPNRAETVPEARCERTVPTVPLPIGGTGTGHAAHNNGTVPTTDLARAERLLADNADLAGEPA